MAEVLVTALVLVLIIVLGYVIKRIGWVSAADFPMFSRIVLSVTLPCALITSFNTFDISPDLLVLALVGVVINLVQQLAGFVVERRRGTQAQAFGVLNVGSYNIGLFAIPYVSSFLGPASIVHASIFDVGNALTGAGVGYGWGMSLSRGEAMVRVGAFVRQMFKSPVFVTYLTLLIMRLLDLTLPPQVITFTSTVGAANTFLAMLMIGIGLELQLTRTKYRSAAKFLGIRYLLSALAALTVWFLTPFDDTVRTVLCMLFFAPMAAMTAGFTSEAGGDVELSTFMTTASVLVAIVMMPLVFALLSA